MPRRHSATQNGLVRAQIRCDDATDYVDEVQILVASVERLIGSRINHPDVERLDRLGAVSVR